MMVMIMNISSSYKFFFEKLTFFSQKSDVQREFWYASVKFCHVESTAEPAHVCFVVTYKIHVNL